MKTAMTEVICLDVFWLVPINWSGLIIIIFLEMYIAQLMLYAWKLFCTASSENNGSAEKKLEPYLERLLKIIKVFTAMTYAKIIRPNSNQRV